ncbi:MAG: hypothetical protein MZW92_46520 [Comamonadaceae bacterium]|nr:hypothetical protein [Comamonadaceae bacterium]
MPSGRCYRRLASASTIEVDAGILIATTVVIIYTVYGGLLADVMTDFIQGIALIVGLVVLAWVVIDAAGGIQVAASHIRPGQLNFFGGPGEPLLATLEKWAIPITGSVIAQELISRILATRTPQTARRAALLGGGIYFAVGMIPVFLGLIGARLLPGLDEPEQLLPRLAAEHLPTLLYIIFAGALISAILSTVDSALLAASALVEHNLIVPLRPHLGDRARVRIARVGVALFGGVAYVLALQAESIYALVVQASALAGAGIFVVVMFGLFTRFGGPRAALAALLVGLGTWLGGEYLIGWPVPYLSSLATALLACVAVGAFEPRAASAG